MKGDQNRRVSKGLLTFFMRTAGAIRMDLEIFLLNSARSESIINVMVPPNEYPMIFMLFFLVFVM